MSRAREQRRRARRDLHNDRAVPAFYYATASTTVPVKCTVRVHKGFALVGSLQGSAGFAERAEIEPRIIFLAEDVPAPRVNAVVAVEPGEAYRVVSADPADDITVAAKVTQLAAGDPLLETLSFPS